MLLQYCQQGETAAAIELLSRPDFDRTSLQQADSQYDATPLHWACESGALELIESLLDLGANLHARTRKGIVPLHWAAESGHAHVVQLLLEREADVDARTAESTTSLHIAAWNTHASVVELLLQYGAQADARSGDRKTPLSLLASSPSTDRESRQACEGLLREALMYCSKSLTTIPEAALKVQRPFSLRLRGNFLSTKALCNLENLVALDLGGNVSFSSTEDWSVMGQIPSLRFLSLAECELTLSNLNGLDHATNLIALDLSGNPLVDLPVAFAQMKKLRRLDLARCKLSAVPSVITQLPKLYSLDLRENSIDRIPLSLSSLEHLSFINLNGCRLRHVPIEYQQADLPGLFAYLRDLESKRQVVYRSQLLLVGYQGVGKTTLLKQLFPPRAVLLKRIPTSLTKGSWQERFCEIRGSQLVYKRPLKNGGWENEERTIELDGATVTASLDDVTWTVQPKAEGRKYELRCKSALEREEWVQFARFQATPTQGISLLHRDIDSADLQLALARCMSNGMPELLAPALPADLASPVVSIEHANQVPINESLQLNIWDFAGQHEYQDGHQLFLSSRAIYLVLWDMTPSRRSEALAELRHWLSTLELQLGSTDCFRCNLLVHIVGSHADQFVGNADVIEDQHAQAIKAVQSIVESIQFTLPYRIVRGVDARSPLQVNSFRTQILADLATQGHLGEEVPSTYLELERLLKKQQNLYRTSVLRPASNRVEDAVLPVMKREELAGALNQDIQLVSRGLKLLHKWGEIVYLGAAGRVGVEELVVAAPEWLTIKVLGGIATTIRQEQLKRETNKGFLPIISHSSLPTLFPSWTKLPSELQDEVIRAIYVFDLGFPATPDELDDNRPFSERATVIPQLLPLLPPSHFIWPRTASKTDLSDNLVQIVELNGIPMGFSSVLLSRLRKLYNHVELDVCWQTGFVFKDNVDDFQVLVTVHEDLRRIRVCISNASNPGEIMNAIVGTKINVGVLRKLLLDRYKGVRIINEFVECRCDTCTTLHSWKWNEQLATKDISISKHIKTTQRPELAASLSALIQPLGRPTEFSHIQLKRIAKDAKEQNKVATVICEKSHTTMTISSLTMRLTEGPAGESGELARLLVTKR